MPTNLRACFLPLLGVVPASLAAFPVPGQTAIPMADKVITDGRGNVVPTLIPPTMTGQELRKGLACLIGSCAVILLTADASAQGAVWSVRAGGGLVNSPTELSRDGNGATVDIDSGVSFAFDLSRTLTPGLEVQIGVLGYRVPIEWLEPHPASTNSFQRSALTIGVMVDLLRLPSTSVYAGPLLAGTSRSSAYASDGTKVIRASGAVGVGLEAGLRWPGFVDRKRLALDANIKWLVLRESLSTNTILGDPIITTIGLVYRF